MVKIIYVVRLYERYKVNNYVIRLYVGYFVVDYMLFFL